MQMERDAGVTTGASASGRVEGAAALPACQECCSLDSNPCFTVLVAPSALQLVSIRDHDEIQNHNKDLHDILCSGE